MASAAVEERVRAWARPRSWLGVIEPSLATTLAWASRCSPAGVDDEQLALATMELNLWIAHLDDYAGADYRRLFQACAAVLDDELADEDGEDDPLGLYRAHDRRMRARGDAQSFYRQEHLRILAAYTRRNADMGAGRRPSFDDYLELRWATIGIDLWISVWAALGVVEAPPAEGWPQTSAEAIDAVTRWHVFQNELHSLDRDLESGTPNLVMLLADDLGSVERAREHLEARSELAVEDFASARAELSTNLHRRGLLALLDACLEGGAELYRQELPRYRVSDRFPVA